MKFILVIWFKGNMEVFLIKQNKPRSKDQWYRVEGTHEAIIDKNSGIEYKNFRK